MRILMVAADPMEFRGLLRHLADVKAIGIAVDWSRSARLGTDEVILSTNGVGAKRAASAVDASLETFRADAIVSTGFCGALAPELEIADVVAGTEIATASRTFPALQ